jgi:acyl transferase domain-containing protein
MDSFCGKKLRLIKIYVRDFVLFNIQNAFNFCRGHPDYIFTCFRVFSSRSDRTSFGRNIISKSDPAKNASGKSAASADPGKKKLVFVYTGMGPQWWAMGRDLYNKEPVFKRAVESGDEVFTAIAGWSVKSELLASEESSRMSETSVAQPANFVIQVALTELWRQWGIVPDAIVGHSVGEVTAAYAAGAISLHDGLAICFHRSRLQQSLARQGGGMVAAAMTPKAASALFRERSLDLTIAAINSSKSLTVSGELKQLHVLCDILKEQNTTHRFLRVEIAYHSPQMDSIKKDFLKALNDLSPRPPRIPLYSSVLGKRVDGVALDAAYWWKNIRRPVHFKQAMDSLISDGYFDFLEIGPHPVLHQAIEAGLSEHGKEGAVLYTLRRKKPELETIYASLGKLREMGYGAPGE